jgi:hypothetical protein
MQCGGAAPAGSSLDSLSGAAAPLVIASPGTKARLLLLERRLTGSNPPIDPVPLHQQAVVQAQAPAATQLRPHISAASSGAGGGASGSGAMVGQPAQPHIEVVIIDPSQDDPAVQGGAAVIAAQQRMPYTRYQKSPTPPPDAPPSAGNKRRKTGRPLHRPIDGAVPTASAASDGGGAKAGGGQHAQQGQGLITPPPPARDNTQQRDKPVRVRASPRAAERSEPAGGSNPPMSPVPIGESRHWLRPNMHTLRCAVL